MKISITVTDNSKIGQRLEKVLADKALGMYAATEAAKHMRPYVPELNSILVNATTFKPFEVTYNTPYARYQYEGRNIRHRTKAGSMSRWDRGANVKPALAKSLENYIKSRLN